MQQIPVNQALNNIKEVIRLYKGNADEHQVLAMSFQVIANTVLAEKEQSEEPREDS